MSKAFRGPVWQLPLLSGGPGFLSSLVDSVLAALPGCRSTLQGVPAMWLFCVCMHPPSQRIWVGGVDRDTQVSSTDGYSVAV